MSPEGIINIRKSLEYFNDKRFKTVINGIDYSIYADLDETLKSYLFYLKLYSTAKYISNFDPNYFNDPKESSLFYICNIEYNENKDGFLFRSLVETLYFFIDCMYEKLKNDIKRIPINKKEENDWIGLFLQYRGSLHECNRFKMSKGRFKQIELISKNTKDEELRKYTDEIIKLNSFEIPKEQLPNISILIIRAIEQLTDYYKEIDAKS